MYWPMFQPAGAPEKQKTFLEINCFEDSCYIPILCFTIVEGRLNFGSAMNDIEGGSSGALVSASYY